MGPRTRLRSWIPQETHYAATGSLKDAPHPEGAAMLARLKKSDYRLSEALLLSNGDEVDFFQEARTRIARGFLREAEELIRLELLSNDGLAPDLVCDLRLELARVHFQNGDYLAALDVTQEAFDSRGVSGISQTTLLQIRSAALFELGEWTRCLADVERIRSLSGLYPEAQSSFYSEILGIKAIARAVGVAEAERLFGRLLSGSVAEKDGLNGDRLLTFLRLRIDLARIRNEDVAALAFASHLMAEAMGDRLYSGLALVDLAFSECESMRGFASRKLKPVRQEFRKIDRLLHECETLTPSSQSAHSLLAYSPRNGNAEFLLESPVDSLLLLKSGLRFDLKSLSCERTSLQERSRKLIHGLAAGPISREELFVKAWSLPFDSERHDVILRNALMRARRQSGAKITSREARVCLDGTLVLGEL